MKPEKYQPIKSLNFNFASDYFPKIEYYESHQLGMRYFDVCWCRHRWIIFNFPAIIYSVLFVYFLFIHTQKQIEENYWTTSLHESIPAENIPNVTESRCTYNDGCQSEVLCKKF